MKFLTVVSNLETSEPMWFGQGGQKDTLDSGLQGGRITAACVDMWEPFTANILELGATVPYRLRQV